MYKKILIVEDDTFFREALFDVLKKQYTVLQAPNGKSAKEILTMESVDLVLSDIQMPGFTGLELLEWARENCSVPFVIMTGFTMAFETKTAYELGAKGFLTKPFRNSELTAALDSILGTNRTNETQQKQVTASSAKKDYCKVSIDEFVAKTKIDFDVYIKLSEEKIIKLAHKGQEIPREKLQQYKEKGLKHLYILKEDFSKLVEFNLSLANIMKGRSDISDQKKINFLKYTSEILLERTFVEGLNKKNMHEAKIFLDLTMSTVAESSENLDLLTLLSAHSDHIYAHSLGVSMYSVMIARQMGINSNVTLFKLSLAGLFHDIGKKEIDREILEKPRHLVSKEERSLIETHVVRGQEILNTLQSIHDDVVRIVFEHHEDQQGLGFPMRKQKFELHPLSKILQCANIFIDNCLAGPNSPQKTGLTAIAHIEKMFGARIDSDCLKALKDLFKVENADFNKVANLRCS